MEDEPRGLGGDADRAVLDIVGSGLFRIDEFDDVLSGEAIPDTVVEDDNPMAGGVESPNAVNIIDDKVVGMKHFPNKGLNELRFARSGGAREHQRLFPIVVIKQRLEVIRNDELVQAVLHVEALFPSPKSVQRFFHLFPIPGVLQWEGLLVKGHGFLHSTRGGHIEHFSRDRLEVTGFTNAVLHVVAKKNVGVIYAPDVFKNIANSAGGLSG